MEQDGATGTQDLAHRARHDCLILLRGFPVDEQRIRSMQVGVQFTYGKWPYLKVYKVIVLFRLAQFTNITFRIGDDHISERIFISYVFQGW